MMKIIMMITLEASAVPGTHGNGQWGRRKNPASGRHVDDSGDVTLMTVVTWHWYELWRWWQCTSGHFDDNGGVDKEDDGNPGRGHNKVSQSLLSLFVLSFSGWTKSLWRWYVWLSFEFSCFWNSSGDYGGSNFLNINLNFLFVAEMFAWVRFEFTFLVG